MTLPNALGVLRILLTFLIVWLIFLPGFNAKLAAFICYLFAAMTDWWDGYFARRLNQISRSGILLDPIADKVLVLGLFLAFAAHRLVAGWIVGLIVAREVLITGVRLIAVLGRGEAIPAAKEGKLKALVQMVTVGLILLLLVLGEVQLTGIWSQVESALFRMIPWLVALTAVLTVVSGVAFFLRSPAMIGPFAVLIASVGGVGYIPFAPGTFGAIAGLVAGWWMVYAGPTVMWVSLAAVVALSVAVSTRAEHELGTVDPGRIVIDEFVGMWLIVAWLRPRGWMTGAVDDFAAAGLAFVVFRIFDIVKPPPLKRLQDLPAGWGVVLDDLGASVYTVLVCSLLHPLLMQAGWAALHQ